MRKRKVTKICIYLAFAGYLAYLITIFLSDERLQSNQRTQVAIGLAVTSIGIKLKSASEMEEKFVFFSTLLPSFCTTGSHGYEYTFYLAYDYDDPVYTSVSHRKEFQR